MEVSVTDINEINIFASSVDSFADEYTNLLRSVSSATDTDERDAQNLLDKIRVKAEQAQREYESAQHALEEAESRCDSAESESSERHWKEECGRRERALESKEAECNEFQKRQEEAEELVNSLRVDFETVRETCDHSASQLEQCAGETTRIIRQAADRIAEYNQNR